MTRWLLTMDVLDALDGICVCGHPASFLITVPPLPDPQALKLCGPCATAYALQTFKNQGVHLEEVCAVFPRLSAAVDEPPKSPLVM